MITLSDIASRFEHFADNHGQIQTFTFGQMDELDGLKMDQYPLMHVFYSGADYDTNVKDYKFEVYFMSRAGNDDNQQIQFDAISDMETLVEDLISDIERGFTSFYTTEQGQMDVTGRLVQEGTAGAYQLQDASVVPMINTKTGLLTGTQLTMTVRVPSPYDSCFKP